ncbi:zinc finger-containing protein [Cryptosporidium canis]|uniref:Zinc finger-containing protein n=1 Tax=Cryptosporidium canis TaxID=195482 RepID=A0A9D5DP73_9CRYT|nr:zinc finger-containing protein [Cryptosporidium canis]
MSIFQPSNQIRLTNVAVVRYKSHGKRFEVACYKNKILNWRSGVEWDLDEVLQIRSIFANVSKGQVANSDDLNLVFGTNNIDRICQIILSKGEIQVSETERSYMLDKQFTDICHMISKMTVNPKNNLPLSVKMIESELKKSGFSVSLNKTTKEQSLKALDILKKRIPEQIERAKMMLKLSIDVMNKQRIVEKLNEFKVLNVSSEENDGIYSITFICDPRYYREIDQLDCKLLLLDSNVKNIDKSSCIDDSSLNCHELQSNKQSLINDTEIKPKISSNKSLNNTEVNPLETNTEILGTNMALNSNTNEAKNAAKNDVIICRKCNIQLNERDAFREHCRSEWHVFNTKRNARGMDPVTEEEFLELQQDLKMGFLAVE